MSSLSESDCAGALPPFLAKMRAKGLNPDDLTDPTPLPELKELESWTYWARKEQLPPDGDWRAWLFLGGRGAGKTRAGAEWVSQLARTGAARRIALIGPTFHDVREVMIEGHSGLRSGVDRPAYEASRRRLIWPNGAQAFAFSAEDPESLRGPQFDAAWCDELCYWARPDEVMSTLQHALRLGEHPRLLVTTTPRPLPALKKLMDAPDTVVSTAPTWNNARHLAPGFIAALRERWTGSVKQRQELLGELIEDPVGALWTRLMLDEACGRFDGDWDFERVVVAVDPPVSVGEDADACGIVAAGLRGGKACVLGDSSVQGLGPAEWAARVATLADSVNADCIVAEANNGGELVRAMLALAAPRAPIRLVHASRGKRTRAEPVAMLYAQGRVAHAARFGDLEDEMCRFGAPGFTQSPDRLDALVWALTDLMLARSDPRLRTL